MPEFFDAFNAGLKSGATLGSNAYLQSQRQKRKDKEDKDAEEAKRQKEINKARFFGLPKDSPEYQAVESGTVSAEEARAKWKEAREKAAKDAQNQQEVQAYRSAIGVQQGPLTPMQDVSAQAFAEAPGATQLETLNREQMARQPQQETPTFDPQRKYTFEELKRMGISDNASLRFANKTGAQIQSELQTGESGGESKPTRTQSIAAQFDKNNPELRSRVGQEIEDQIGTLSQYVLSRSAGVYRPPQPGYEADQSLRDQAMADEALKQYVDDYDKIRNGEIDKAIDYLKTQALGGNPVEPPNPGLEARGKAAATGLADVKKTIQQMLDEISKLEGQ